MGARAITGPGELWRAWRRLVRRSAQRLAVIEADRDCRWTVAQLDEAAQLWAPQLASFRRGQRVAFQMANGAEWLALFLALQARGLAAMPLDAGLPPAGCLELARRLKAAAVLVGSAWHSVDPSAPGTLAACIKVTSGTSA